MSTTAFQDKWVRMSAAKRMLVILTYLSRKDTIRIPFADLESVEVGEGMIETFNGSDLVVMFAAGNTKVSFLGDDRAMEKTQWQPPTTSAEVTDELLHRMSQATGLPVSTVDDALMAEREKAGATAVPRAAAEARRRQPLPVPIPATPPLR